MKRWLIVALAGIALLVACAAPKPTPIAITAVDLYESYASNEIAADQEFKDRDLIVTGAAGWIGRDNTGVACAILRSSHERIPPLEAALQLVWGVECRFDAEHEGALGGVGTDDWMKVRGTCLGMANPLSEHVVLENCRLVD